MFEVKYPTSHGLDGKIHKIEISSAVEVNIGGINRIIIYGFEKGKKVILEVAYFRSEKKWVKVPHTQMEYINLTSPLRKKKNVTEVMKKELDGRKITNSEELDYPFFQKAKIQVFHHPITNNYFITNAAAVSLGWLDKRYKCDYPTYLEIDEKTSYPLGYYCLSFEGLEYIKKEFIVEMKEFVVKKSVKKETEKKNRSISKTTSPNIKDTLITSISECLKRVKNSDNYKNIDLKNEIIELFNNLLKFISNSSEGILSANDVSTINSLILYLGSPAVVNFNHELTTRRHLDRGYAILGDAVKNDTITELDTIEEAVKYVKNFVKKNKGKYFDSNVEARIMIIVDQISQYLANSDTISDEILEKIKSFLSRLMYARVNMLGDGVNEILVEIDSFINEINNPRRGSLI